MSYAFTTDNIEVRSITEGRVPKYIVNGRAMVSNMPHTYQYFKDSKGKVKSLKSLFTENCVKSIKKQAGHKKLFVDANHELSCNSNIKKALKGKLSEADLKNVERFYKNKQFPLAKIADIEINDDSLMLYTEMNPAFRELDSEHEKYFDAVWYSLENKFLNGISVNFGDAKVIEVDGVEKIDDIDVLGFSYVDAPSPVENSIMEVAIRAIQEGEKMEDKEKENKAKEEAEETKKKLETTQNELKALKDEKAKAETEAKEKKESDEKKTAEQQKADYEQQIKDLEKKNEELSAKKGEAGKEGEENNSAKGTVKQEDKYGKETKGKYDGKFYEENIKEITKGHDETIKTIREGKSPMIDRQMEGFGEMINLQAQINNPTLGMKFDSPMDEALARKLLEKERGDIIVPRQK